MMRWTYGSEHAPFRRWRNQWGRDPERPLPSSPATIELESEKDLVGLSINDIAPGDDRRIDENGFTYVKLNGIMYWLKKSHTSTKTRGR